MNCTSADALVIRRFQLHWQLWPKNAKHSAKQKPRQEMWRALQLNEMRSKLV